MYNGLDGLAVSYFSWDFTAIKDGTGDNPLWNEYPLAIKHRNGQTTNFLQVFSMKTCIYSGCDVFTGGILKYPWWTSKPLSYGTRLCCWHAGSSAIPLGNRHRQRKQPDPGTYRRLGTFFFGCSRSQFLGFSGCPKTQSARHARPKLDTGGVPNANQPLFFGNGCDESSPQEGFIARQMLRPGLVFCRRLFLDMAQMCLSENGKY